MKASNLVFFVILLCSLAACTQSKTKQGLVDKVTELESSAMFLDPAGFQKTIDGKETDLYKLSNANGLEVYVTNFGAVIVAILTPDREGNMDDIALGYNDVLNYGMAGDPNFGAVVGRYGNRIDGGKFTLDGKTHELPINEDNNNNQLHGGKKGFGELVWDVESVSENSIQLSLHSPDGDMGYPGALDMTVEYILTNEDALEVVYRATTDAPTVINLTQHTYFNLLGEGKGSILDHELMMKADHFIPVNERLIPTGEIAAVEGTPMDFTSPAKIGSRVNENFEQLALGGGYDHCWVISREGDEPELCATVYCEETGRFMEVLTTEPGVQLYIGNFLNGSQVGKSGVAYEKRTGLCLETQHYPDSPNQPNFPSTVLRPNEEYHTKTVFKFSVK
jgi:aldose 1-epimerase